jgi:hypothetical protein
MVSVRERWAEAVLLATAVIAGIALFDVVASSRTEAATTPPVCLYNKCKPIKYYYNCNTQKGVVLSQYDCSECKYGGLCNVGNSGGSNDRCDRSKTPQKFDFVPVTTICACTYPNNPPTYVEAEGNDVSPTLDLGTRWVCAAGGY